MDLMAAVASVQEAVENAWNPPLNASELRRCDALMSDHAIGLRSIFDAPKRKLTIAERIADNEAMGLGRGLPVG